LSVNQVVDDNRVPFINTFAKWRKGAKIGFRLNFNSLILLDFENRIFGKDSQKSKLAKVLIEINN